MKQGRPRPSGLRTEGRSPISRRATETKRSIEGPRMPKGPKSCCLNFPAPASSSPDWSLDGRYLNYYSVQLGRNILFALPLEGERKPIEAARSPFQILAVAPLSGQPLFCVSIQRIRQERNMGRRLNPAPEPMKSGKYPRKA